MTVEGHVENGRVVLEGLLNVPDGTIVTVSVPAERQNSDEGSGSPSLYERMKPFIGSVPGLPSDFAMNHDHYLHGQPKRQ